MKKFDKSNSAFDQKGKFLDGQKLSKMNRNEVVNLFLQLSNTPRDKLNNRILSWLDCQLANKSDRLIVDFKEIEEKFEVGSSQEVVLDLVAFLISGKSWLSINGVTIKNLQTHVDGVFDISRCALAEGLVILNCVAPRLRLYANDASLGFVDFQCSDFKQICLAGARIQASCVMSPEVSVCNGVILRDASIVGDLNMQGSVVSRSEYHKVDGERRPPFSIDARNIYVGGSLRLGQGASFTGQVNFNDSHIKKNFETRGSGFSLLFESASQGAIGRTILSLKRTLINGSLLIGDKINYSFRVLDRLQEEHLGLIEDFSAGFRERGRASRT